jgi:glycosyltransferase involved in cell wall biosynthesis
MWKANRYFFTMLPLIISCDSVEEIIIINNNSAETPDNDLLKNEKVIIHDSGRNLYFNRSMNLGAEIASSEILCLLNDDVIFDPAIFRVIASAYSQGLAEQEKVGMIYPHPSFFNRANENAELIQKLTLVECKKRLDGFGCCMFVSKNNYVPIPDELVQHFGDVWLDKNQIKNGRKNYWLYNWVIVTEMRVTTSVVPEIRGIIENDWKIAKSVFDKYEVEIEDDTETSPVFEAGIVRG